MTTATIDRTANDELKFGVLGPLTVYKRQVHWSRCEAPGCPRC